MRASQVTLCGVAALIVLLLAAPWVLQAQIPQKMNYQVMLTDDSNEPLADQAVALVFYIFDDVTAGGTGDALWTETHNTTTNSIGVVSVTLGSTNPIGIDFDVPLWLEVWVNGAKMTPRRELVSAPYALGTEETGDITGVTAGEGLDGGGTEGGVTLDVNVGTGLEIATDNVQLTTAYSSGSAYDSRFVNEGEASSVTAAMVTPNIVSSVDGVSNDGGDVDLVAGANITITPNDGANTITIAATGGASDGDWTISGDDMYSAVSGNVGIGTSTPAEKLVVDGDISIITGGLFVSGSEELSLGASSLRRAWSNLISPYDRTFLDADEDLYLEAGEDIYVRPDGGTDWVHFDNTNSRVGVGLLSPSGRLHVNPQGQFAPTQGNGWGDFTVGNGTYGLCAGVSTGGGGAGICRVWPKGGIETLSFTSAEYSAGGYQKSILTLTETGEVGVRCDVDAPPSVDFEVRGRTILASDASSASALRVTAPDITSAYEVIQAIFGDLGSGADALDIEIGSGSSGSAQYMECNIATDLEFRIDAGGEVYADGSFHPGGADVAELLRVATGARSVEPGDVMVIDPGETRAVVASLEPRSTLVVGVVSTKPGVVCTTREWDGETTAEGEAEGFDLATVADRFDEIPLAVVGVVPCKVSAENGPINPGDLLVTSSTPGHAMRDESPAAGTILGKALGSLAVGTGVIDVLVTLQ